MSLGKSKWAAAAEKQKGKKSLKGGGKPKVSGTCGTCGNQQLFSCFFVPGHILKRRCKVCNEIVNTHTLEVEEYGKIT